MKVEQNIQRLKYLLSLYKMTVKDLLLIISDGLSKPITEEEIIADEVKLSHLKRIDKIFNKGLHFYMDPKAPEQNREASIFFRKSNFNVDLNLGAKRIVNQFEEFKISLSGIAKLADLKMERQIPVYSTKQDPKEISVTIRKLLYPKFCSVPKDFLKALIGKLADYNILVFEFVETWNKKDKANIDGFFLNPNVIVLKRQQISFRREIFTLAHELGHYLLNEEEVEQLDIQNMASDTLNVVERWCNDFAYYFLAGEYDSVIKNLGMASAANDYHHSDVETISINTHLSKIALFTRLLYQRQISSSNYNQIKADFDEQFKQRVEEEKKQRELDKQNGISQRGSTPKAINSPLLISTIQTAFYEGVINEYDVCKTLNIKPEKLDQFLQ